MKVLFISRKKLNGIGGLSRFVTELYNNYSEPKILLSPYNILLILKIPFVKFDHIHLCDATLLPLGVILKLFSGKPLTVTAHGLDLTFANTVYQMMLKILLPIVDKIVLDSKKAENIGILRKIDKRRITLIIPGISVSHFSHNSLKLPRLLKLLKKQDKIIIITVGNLVSRKGHAWFLEHVMSKLPEEYVYVIIGDGPERKNIEYTIKKNNLKNRVFLMGKVSDKLLSIYLRKSDIYVCPNIRRKDDFEGFGIAAGEAAALGLPVVASDVDGLSELIKNGKNGFLIDPDSSSYFRSLKLLKSVKIRINTGKRAGDYMKSHYLWAETVISYRKLFLKFSDKKI